MDLPNLYEFNTYSVLKKDFTVMNFVYAQTDNDICAKWIESHNVCHSMVDKTLNV